jgi:hypothetical protein
MITSTICGTRVSKTPLRRNCCTFHPISLVFAELAYR